MIRVGIVGTGGMARYHAEAFNSFKNCRVVAGCDVNEERLKKFAEKHKIKETFNSVDKMLESVKLDAVSVVTPDSSHTEVSLKVIGKGIHVLCEKPLATNEKDARKMAEAARKKRVITGVNFSYRKSAAVEKASRMVKEGKLGRIIHVEASYLQSWLVSKAWGDWHTSPQWLWRLSKRHRSNGTLGDIGVHIYDMVSYIAGDFREIHCVLKTFDKGVKKLGEYVFDANDSFISTVKFKNGALGTIHSSRWATGHINSLRLRVYGDKGALEIDLDKSCDSMRVCIGSKNIDKANWAEVKCPEVKTIYERFINSVKLGKQMQPDFETGARIQAYLDKSFLSDKLKKWVKIYV